MKFIVDAQLPRSLSEFLKTKGHDSIHKIELPEKKATDDNDVLRLSLEEKRIIISKDNDFFESYIVKEQPEKLVLVTTGNIPNKQLLKLFNMNMERIEELLLKFNVIEIDRTNILVHF